MNDDIGKTGIEYVFENYLRGQNGKKQTDMSVSGETTGEYITKEAIAGDDVSLTIDANLQQVAEEALKNNIEKINNGGFGKAYNAPAGSVVVLNVKTGEVLAMCSYPDFEPQLFVNGISTDKWNEYNDPKKSALLDRCIQSAYAPGSIFKMVPATAALETGKVTTTEKINDTGVFHIGDTTKQCWIYPITGHGHGLVNISQAIQDSCNYFFYEMGERLGIQTIQEYAKMFGLGSKTGIELPGEIAGTIAGVNDEKWYTGDTLNAVIGQADNNYTPIQLVRYIAILVNGGKDPGINIVKDITDADGNKVDTTEIQKYVSQKLGIVNTKLPDINIKPQNLQAILEGMKDVTTDEQGTAYSVFKNFNIEVGGKTGSAEAGKDENGKDKVNAWFVGFAPYDDPEIAIVVSVENGQHGVYTSEVARDIWSAYFGLNGNIQEDRTAQPVTQSQN